MTKNVFVVTRFAKMEKDEAKPGPSAGQDVEGAVGGAATDVNIFPLPTIDEILNELDIRLFWALLLS